MLTPDTPFGRYVIVRVLGMGGMGIVYEAQHSELRKRVAIKVMKAELAANPEARTRFLREGEAAARIGHPHVVDVSDVGTHQGLPFLVMEYLEGEDLGALLAREGRLSIERAIDVLLPVIAGIAAGHSRGVVHRDLKPQNIFLARGWDVAIVPKVLDFGVSKLLDPTATTASVTRAGALYGTLNYMSPEQAHGATDVGVATDQYAMGAILYECLTGHRTYPGEHTLDVLRRVASGEFTPPRALRPDLPVALESAVLVALSLEPAARFESMTALGRALMPFASARAAVVWGSTFSAVAPPATAPGPSPLIAPLETPWPARGGDTVALPLEPRAASPTVALPDSGPPARRRGLWPLAGGVLAGIALASWFLVRQRPASSPAVVPVYTEPAATAPAPPPAPRLVAPAPPVAAPAPEPAAVPEPDPTPERVVAPEPATRTRARHKEARRSVRRTNNRAPLVD